MVASGRAGLPAKPGPEARRASSGRWSSAFSSNAFGTGIAYPFLVIYLHNVRGIGLGIGRPRRRRDRLASGLLVGPLIGPGRRPLRPRAHACRVARAARRDGYALFPLVQRRLERRPRRRLSLGSAAPASGPRQSTLPRGLAPPTRRHAAYAVQRGLFNLGLGLGGMTGGLIATHRQPERSPSSSSSTSPPRSGLRRRSRRSCPTRALTALEPSRTDRGPVIATCSRDRPFMAYRAQRRVGLRRKHPAGAAARVRHERGRGERAGDRTHLLRQLCSPSSSSSSPSRRRSRVAPACARSRSMPLALDARLAHRRGQAGPGSRRQPRPRVFGMAAAIFGSANASTARPASRSWPIWCPGTSRAATGRSPRTPGSSATSSGRPSAGSSWRQRRSRSGRSRPAAAGLAVGATLALERRIPREFRLTPSPQSA